MWKGGSSVQVYYKKNVLFPKSRKPPNFSRNVFYLLFLGKKCKKRPKKNVLRPMLGNSLYKKRQKKEEEKRGYFLKKMKKKHPSSTATYVGDVCCLCNPLETQQVANGEVLPFNGNPQENNTSILEKQTPIETRHLLLLVCYRLT